MIIYSKSPFGAHLHPISQSVDLRDHARNALNTVKECVSQLCSLRGVSLESRNKTKLGHWGNKFES